MKETIKDLENINDQFEHPFTAIENAIAFLKEEDKYRQVVRDIETILFPGYFVDGAPELNRFRRLYKKVKQKHFPEIRTLKQRIEEMIYNICYPGSELNIKELKHLLIELRDKEDKE